jgi:membrane protein
MRIPGGGRMSFGALLKRLYVEYTNHAVPDSAAQLGYYFVFSLFPFLFFLATLAAYLPLESTMELVLGRLHAVVPTQAMALVDTHVRELVARPSPKLLTVGLALTLYSASRGVDAIRKAMNLAYDVKESRSWWRTELLAVGMTVGGAALFFAGITVLVVGGDLGLWLAHRLGIDSVYAVVLRWARWPITAFVVMTASALTYYVLPDVRQRFKFITPGSVASTLAWLLAGWGFSQYVSRFGTYNVTYGAIGGVIVLMTWFYISGVIFLLGGEMNAIMERCSPEGKAAGARAPGERPPPKAERPSAVPVGAAKSQGVADRVAPEGTS